MKTRSWCWRMALLTGAIGLSVAGCRSGTASPTDAGTKDTGVDSPAKPPDAGSDAHHDSPADSTTDSADEARKRGAFTSSHPGSVWEGEAHLAVGTNGLRLEDDLPAQDPGQVQTLRNVPDSPWRPLGDVKSSATNAADALQELKALAARAGGNALVRLAEGAGSTRTTTSSLTSSSSDSVNIPLGRGLSVAGGGSTSSASTDSVSVTEFAGLGTALRLAKPGSEPYVGISCLDYIGGWDAWRRTYGRNSIRDYALHRPYVTTVEGPAEKAGIRPGQLIVGWKRKGELGSHTATSCKAIAAAVSGAGVDGSLQLIVLDPAGILTKNSEGTSNFEPNNPSARSVTVTIEAIPSSWYRSGDAPFERAALVAPSTPTAPTPTSFETPPESWYRSHEAPQPSSPTPPAATEAPARPTLPAPTDIAARLKKLEELKTQKLITDAEYKKQRERILNEGL